MSRPISSSCLCNECERKRCSCGAAVLDLVCDGIPRRQLLISTSRKVPTARSIGPNHCLDSKKLWVWHLIITPFLSRLWRINHPGNNITMTRGEWDAEVEVVEGVVIVKAAAGVVLGLQWEQTKGIPHQWGVEHVQPSRQIYLHLVSRDQQIRWSHRYPHHWKLLNQDWDWDATALASGDPNSTKRSQKAWGHRGQAEGNPTLWRSPSQD